jgi:hypothetical protein
MLRPIVQQFLYGTATFNPSAPRLLRKLRLSISLCDFGLKLGPPLFVPVRDFCAFNRGQSLAKCEPDKSEHYQDRSGYKQPMRVLQR